jgi:hypothetical protein
MSEIGRDHNIRLEYIKIRNWNMKQQVIPKRRKISAELRIVKHHIIAITTSSLKQAQVSLNLHAVTVSTTLILFAAFHSHGDYFEGDAAQT